MLKPEGRTGIGFALALIPIGLEYIASSIEDVVDDVNMLDMLHERRDSLPHLLESFSPDLVGISMSATEHHNCLSIALSAKNMGISTVLGGYHPTAIPDEMLSHEQVDMVVRGEGELTMRELVQRGSPENILGVSYKENGKVIHNPDRPLIEDLDSLPFPARHLRRHEYIGSLGGRLVDEIHTSRGCWGRCTFCCEPCMSRSRQRFRSPENVMKEIEHIYNTVHGRKPLSILIGDPNFMGDAKRVSRLCDLLGERKLDIVFQAMVRADSMARHPEVVRKMCENNIAHFCMGIESPSLKDLNATRKGITIEIQKKAVQSIREFGGVAAGTFVIGLPDQSEDEIEYFPTFAKEIGLMSATFGIATPFPGTEFYISLEKEGLIFEHDWAKYDENSSVFKLSGIDRQRIEELRTYCLGKFWTADTFVDWLAVEQKRGAGRKSLSRFVADRIAELVFLAKAGSTQQASSESMINHFKVFVQAMADSRVEEYTKKLGMHQVIDMSRFLAILGEQTIQLTIRYENRPLTSYIMKTTRNAVEYIRVISGRQDGATIDL
ncbi:B12-binding domain-containing radical SAM protein, partial [Candidatus Bathyarchaeota archaeon]|nr:B12-binding domain-containing radical SAM protein [Candidatus Bathyarchaeota archaeon]